MAHAAGATAYGAVTIASREPGSDAVSWRLGDVLGLVGPDITTVGSDPVAVGAAVVEALVSSRPGAEILTLVTGSEAPPG